MKSLLCALAILLLFHCATLGWSAQATNVTYEQLLHANDTPQNWLMYGGDYK